MRVCATCGRELPPDADPQRVTCSTSCRVRRHYLAKAQRRAAALSALREAVRAGDPSAVEALAAEVVRLSGERAAAA